MKKKIISTALAGTLALGIAILPGCASNPEMSDKNTSAKISDAKLSEVDYEFEKEYTFGDFNAYSNKDIERQDGVDTFEDNDVVFEDITYDELMTIMNSPGNYMIQLSGSWCHNSRAMSPAVNQYAKEFGIKKIYSYDFNIDNGEDGKFFVRMSNEKTTIGSKYNYLYGEMVSHYLSNLDDWIEYPSSHSTALTYTNSEGKEITVGRLQQPIVLVYNKDNTVDYSGQEIERDKYPVMYAFEEMVERDTKGIYTKKTDDQDNPVLDENGKQVREYKTDEYYSHVKSMFEFLKDNGIEIDNDYTKTDYVRDNFNSYGEEIFSSSDQINIYPVTFRQLKWLMQQEGDSVIMIGGAGSEETRAVIKQVNDAAVAKNVRVYLYDPEVDGNQTIKWGYSKSTNILDEDATCAPMYKTLLEYGLTNLSVTHTLSTGEPLISEPFLFSFNKDAKDKDGFAGPVKTGVELTFNNDSSSRYYIGKESNQKSCDKKIASVLSSYAGEESSSK